MERILTGFLKCQVRTISMLSSSDHYDDTKVVRDAILRINLLLNLYQNKSILHKKERRLGSFIRAWAGIFFD